MSSCGCTFRSPSSRARDAVVATAERALGLGGGWGEPVGASSSSSAPLIFPASPFPTWSSSPSGLVVEKAAQAPQNTLPRHDLSV